MKTSFFATLFVPVFLILLFSGCGDKQKLGGKVSFPDGEPLTCGMIIFSSDDCLSRATIKPDGKFDVGTFSEKDGLPPGRYKVYITGATKVTGKRKVKLDNVDKSMGGEATMAEEDILEPLIAAKFGNRDTTPLEVVIPGENVYNIVVERP